MSDLTLGERRVRTTFNPSDNSAVAQIKQHTAGLINFINEAAPKPSASSAELSEFERLQAEAMTRYEDACHWAVKLMTA